MIFALQLLLVTFVQSGTVWYVSDNINNIYSRCDSPTKCDKGVTSFGKVRSIEACEAKASDPKFTSFTWHHPNFSQGSDYASYCYGISDGKWTGQHQMNVDSGTHSKIPPLTPTPADIWFEQPAFPFLPVTTGQNDALPVGNGRLGALVFGEPKNELLQINEDSIWKRSWMNSTINPASADTAKCVTAVRGLLAQNKYGDAEATAECLMGHGDGSTAPAFVNSLLRPYQPLMDLLVNFSGPATMKEGSYTRGLNLSNGVAFVNYTSAIGSTSFHRTIFASAQDNVIVMRIEKTGPQKISLSLTMNRFGTDKDTAAVSASSHKQLDLLGSLNYDNGVSYLGFVGAVRIITDGGAVALLPEGSGEPTNPALNVQDADAVTILIAGASNFDQPTLQTGGIQRVVQQTLDAAEKKGVATILAEHVAAFEEISQRSMITFGSSTPPAVAQLPTDQRMAAARKSGADGDPALFPLLFRFGRYLLASSSNPISGSHPANLQGVWNGNMNPSWNSEYTTNINLEMNYWPAEVADLADMTPPLLAFVKRIAANGVNTARTLYNASGWCQHHDTTLWAETVPIDGVQWGMWPYGGTWLTRQLFEHYLFSGDLAYLKEIYPLLRGASLFVLDYLSVDARYPGKLLSGPSVSPENTFKVNGQAEHSLSMGPTIDHEVIRDLFNNTVRAAKVLGRDDPLVQKLLETAQKLPARRLSKRYNMLQEWIEDYEEAQPDMRHFSPVYGESRTRAHA
jgi:alpha-L-fucosidase 2